MRLQFTVYSFHYRTQSSSFSYRTSPVSQHNPCLHVRSCTTTGQVRTASTNKGWDVTTPAASWPIDRVCDHHSCLLFLHFGREHPGWFLCQICFSAPLAARGSPPLHLCDPLCPLLLYHCLFPDSMPYLTNHSSPTLIAPRLLEPGLASFPSTREHAVTGCRAWHAAPPGHHQRTQGQIGVSRPQSLTSQSRTRTPGVSCFGGGGGL